MVKKLNSFQLLKNVSREKISLTNQRSKFFHMIKTKFSRIPAGKKNNMAAENVVNDTENTNCNNLSTLAIFHAVQAAQGQLQQQNMDVDVPFIGNNIPAINRDYIHQKVSDSQLDTEDQFVNESQLLLQSLQGNSVLPQQDQLSSPASSTGRSHDGVTMDFSREDGIPTSKDL